jgi:hypothetical protein
MDLSGCYIFYYMGLYRIVWGNGDGRYNSIPKTVNLIGEGGGGFSAYPSLRGREIPHTHLLTEKFPVIVVTNRINGVQPMYLHDSRMMWEFQNFLDPSFSIERGAVGHNS